MKSPEHFYMFSQQYNATLVKISARYLQISRVYERNSEGTGFFYTHPLYNATLVKISARYLQIWRVYEGNSRGTGFFCHPLSVEKLRLLKKYVKIRQNRPYVRYTVFLKGRIIYGYPASFLFGKSRTISNNYNCCRTGEQC